MAAVWPFFATRLAMLEMVFAKTDAGIFAYYDERLVPAPLRRIGDALRAQLAGDTVTVLEIGGSRKLLDSEPWIAESLRLRNIYIEPLSMLQAELLQRHRAAPEPVLERAIMVTIAGVAAGLRNTG
jgi:phosphoenolpyruvate carboxylase